MEEGKLIFNCPECDIRLSVEPRYAGVVGPCPHCGETIKSPEPHQLAPPLPTIPPPDQADYPKLIDPPEMLDPAKNDPGDRVLSGAEEAMPPVVQPELDLSPAQPGTSVPAGKRVLAPESAPSSKLDVTEVVEPSGEDKSDPAPPSKPSRPAAEKQEDFQEPAPSVMEEPVRGSQSRAEDASPESSSESSAEIISPRPVRLWYREWWRWATVVVLLFVGYIAVDLLREPEPTKGAQSGAGSDQVAGDSSPAESARENSPDAPPVVKVRLPDRPAEPVDIPPQEPPNSQNAENPDSVPPENSPHVVKVRLPARPNLVPEVTPPAPPEVAPPDPTEVAPPAPPEVTPPAPPELDPKQRIEAEFAAVDDVAFLGHSPERLLKEFLAAEKLIERWPMMATESGPHELLGSMLDQPLPPVVGVEVEYQDAHPESGYVDHVHRVTLEDGAGSTRSHRVVVRQWQEPRAPKVLADPLLDLLGGRLQRFLSRPLKEEGEFDVVISVLANCSDPELPDPEGKFSLKLMALDHGGEIGRAHVMRGGSISKLLTDGSFRLSYGNPTACRLRLRWNHEERPKQPWLEATEITRFGWGPSPKAEP